MTHQMMIVCAILACAVVLFVWGRPRTDMVGVGVVVALMITRILTPTEALEGFGSPVVILLAAIFIVSAGLVNTGVTQRLGDLIVRIGGGNETRLIALIMLLAGMIGSVLNSAAIVAMLIPVVLTIANKTGLNRKRLLMPLCIAVMTSGMMTLIASSPNIIIDQIAREHGVEPPLGFFSFTPFGVVVLAIGIVYMLVAGRYQLSRQRGDQAGTEPPTVFNVLDRYGLTEKWHRLHLSAESVLTGQTVAAQRDMLRERYALEVLGFEKYVRGKIHFAPALPETVFEATDVVFVLVDKHHVDEVGSALSCVVKGPREERQRREVLQDIGVAEVIAAPDSKSIGHTVAELDLPANYRLTVLGSRHRGRPITDDCASHTVDFGDTLLVGGTWSDIDRLSDDRQNFLLLNLPAEHEQRLPARRRAPVAVAILVAMVAIMASSLLPNSTAALVAALAMIATGCVRLDTIYRLISWPALVLIAGMLPLATALTKTGASTLMAHALVGALGSAGPIVMLATVFAVTALVSLFVSNTATAVLIAPVVIETAHTLHVSPQGFAITVAIACSAAFVTPVSSPTNMLVMEPGGYRFIDYVKVGLPMLLLTMIATVTLAALIYFPS